MRKKARYSVFALALGVCALAIPATASAAGGYSLANAITGGSSDSTQPSGGDSVAVANAHRTPSELAQTTAAGEPSGSGGSPQVDAGSTAPNAILSGAHEPSTAEPTFVSDSTGTTSDGFDWASAALGAGTATLVALALAGGALLTIRRRTAVSPSG
jgi:hypothetical protein